MIIDKRKQKRKITVGFSQFGYSNDLDKTVNEILTDLEIVVEQRKLDDIKIHITVE